MLSVGRGEEAVGSESLFRSDGPKQSSDEDTSMRSREGLHNHAQHDKKRYNKTYQELLWYPDTHDFARGLSLGNQSSSLKASVVEQSGRRVLPFLDPSASPDGAAFLFLSPPAGGGRTFLFLLLVFVGGVRLDVFGR